MSIRAKSKKRSASKTVEAPHEFGFSSPDTPRPGRVAPTGPEEPTSSRWRGVWGGLKLGFGMLVVVAASLAIAWGAHRFALTTPRFAIVDFSVSGNRRASDDRVVRAAGLEKGTNVFAVELDAAERKLLQDPWIASARLTRKLPGSISIEISEREASALALLDGELHVLAKDGLPFKMLAEGDPRDLPIVTGLSGAGFGLDRGRELERAKHALEVLRVYDSLPMARVYPPEEVHLEPEGSTILMVGRDGIALHLGRDDWRRKLAMAARVVGKLQAQGAEPGVVFLDNEAHEERVVVRMR
jgi:cell division protein FtsQ